MNEQRCDTCKHWSQVRYTGRDAWGDCTIEIPPCLSGPKQMVRRDHGKTCPCWEEKVEEASE